MEAMETARQAIAHIKAHERTCTDRWRESKAAFDELARKFDHGSAQRQAAVDGIQHAVDTVRTILVKLGAGVVLMLCSGLTGAIWFIVTHKWQ